MYDPPSQAVLDVAPQGGVRCELRRLRPSRRALGMPLRRGGAINHGAGARGRVAAQLPRHRRARSIRRAISCTPCPWTLSSAISSRSANDRYRPDGSGADGARCDGGMPPASRNHRDPTDWDTPPCLAASSLERPTAIASQNRRRSSRFATPGRLGDRNGALSRRSAPRFRLAIASSIHDALRRPIEMALDPRSVWWTQPGGGLRNAMAASRGASVSRASIRRLMA